ncbi:MAG: DUF2065 domain-containing protein [Pseudomonadota bacterium]
MEDFFAAFSLLLVLEGLFYAAFPNAMRNAMNTVLSLPDTTLRRYGFVSAVIGLVALYFVRGWM